MAMPKQWLNLRKKRSWCTFRDDEEGEVLEASETQDNGGWVVEVRSEILKRV